MRNKLLSSNLQKPNKRIQNVLVMPCIFMTFMIARVGAKAQFDIIQI